ncbi:unnamed protein product [Arabidopsis lyrata]|nr:unnamed protein product [Arabidopsis lyrata]
MMPPRNVGSLVVAQYHRRRCGSRYFSGKPPHKPIKDMKEEFQGVVDSRSRQAVDGMAKRFPKLFEISSRALTFIYGGRGKIVNTSAGQPIVAEKKVFSEEQTREEVARGLSICVGVASAQIAKMSFQFLTNENNEETNSVVQDVNVSVKGMKGDIISLKTELTVNKENNHIEVEKLKREVTVNKENNQREVEKLTTEVRLNKEDKEREVEKINLQLHSFRQFLSNHVLIPIHQRNPVTAKVEENLQLSRLQDYMARLRRFRLHLKTI